MLIKVMSTVLSVVEIMMQMITTKIVMMNLDDDIDEDKTLCVLMLITDFELVRVF